MEIYIIGAIIIVSLAFAVVACATIITGKKKPKPPFIKSEQDEDDWQ